MPLYEYLCSKCGNKFERLQKFSDAPVTVHEGCGGAVERLISAAGLHFKGSGWYVTDYARNSGKGETKSDSQSDGAKTETKSDTAKTGSGTKSEPAKTDTKSSPATKKTD